MTHPFEQARLGKAPFRCVDVRQVWHEMPGFGRKPGGCCAFCGTGILDAYRIRSSDGREFDVGSTCVEKTHADVDGFRAVRAAHVKAKRDAGAAQRRQEARAAWEAQRAVLEAQRAEAAEAWRAVHPDLCERLAKWEDGGFVGAMLESYEKWGCLTDAQTAAVQAAFDRVDRSRHVGEVGQRVRNAEVRVVRCVHIDTDTSFYPPRRRYLVAMETVDGAQLTWWTSAPEGTSELFERADFTVKSHGEYKGVKQTVVQRVKFRA